MVEERKLLLISNDEQGKFILNEASKFIGKDPVWFNIITNILAGDNWRFIDYEGEHGFDYQLHDLVQDIEEFDNILDLVRFVMNHSLRMEYYEVLNNATLIHSDMIEVRGCYYL